MVRPWALLCCGMFGIALAHCAAAQDYPNRPIRLIIAVPAGGSPDVVARMLAPKLAELLGQPLVIENRAGAGGVIGVELTAKAAADGYTLLLSGSGPLTIAPFVQGKVPYDTLKDFAPISLISINPFVLITHPSVPAGSVAQLIALARARPGKLNYASAGNGSTNHLAMELLKSMARIDITHVPYKGGPPAVTDVVGGHADLMLNSIPPVMPQIKAGRLKLLGISSAKRSPQLPGVPTISEAGVPGYEAIIWFGLLAPAATPREIVAKIGQAVTALVRSPEMRERFAAQGADAIGSGAQEFARFLQSDMEKYARIVKLSGARAD